MASLNLDSAPRKTHSTIESLYNFLTDFRNFPAVLPAEKIADFQADEQSCSFVIQGIAALKVQLENKVPNSEILYNITGPANSMIKLTVLLTGEPDQPGTSDVQMAAHLNPFLKAMAEKPLRTLVNTIALKISELEIKP